MRHPQDDPDRDAGDDDREIRYSLTAHGEAVLAQIEVGAARFHGFGPCVTPSSELVIPR
jgi:hypothetical protein